MLGKLLKRKKKNEGAEGDDAPERDQEEAKSAKGGEEGVEGAEGGEGEDGEGGGKKKKSKKLIIIGLVLVLVIAIGGGAYLMFLRKDTAEIPPDASAPASHASADAPAAAYYTLPEFLVNLNTASKQASFLKMTVVLQLQSQEDAKKVEAALPRVLDNMNTYLREMRATDLSGSAGIYRLREELLVRVNKTVSPVKVDDILFKEIIVQ